MKERNSEYLLNLPVYGAAADIARGAFVKPGVTAGTDNGMLIAATASANHLNVLGRLMEGLDYSVEGQSLMAGTAFITKPVMLAINGAKLFEIEYSQLAADDVATTQTVTTTTATVTSLEDDIDGAFLYVTDGDGEGQTNYLTASAAGSCTLKAAFGTSLASGDTFIKILPRFHSLLALSADGTMLRSQAAAGAWVEAKIIDNFIYRNNRKQQLDPTKHAALTGLTSLRSVRFTALIAVTGIPASMA